MRLQNFRSRSLIDVDLDHHIFDSKSNLNGQIMYFYHSSNIIKSNQSVDVDLKFCNLALVNEILL